MANYVHSPWRKEPVTQTLPSLARREAADVVVIGGGVVGLSTAYFLAKAGSDVVLLERGAVGSQASTKNFGELCPAIWKFDGPLAQRRLQAQFARGALERLKRVTAEEGIDCELKESRYWHLAQSQSQMRELEEEAHEHRELGFDSQAVGRDAVAEVSLSDTFVGGVYTRGGAMNPYLLIEGLKQAVLRLGVRVYEGTEVIEVIDGPRAKVLTRDGSVSASHCVIAANPFSAALGIDTSFSMPLKIFALATKPLAPDIARRVGPKSGESATDFGDRASAPNRCYQRFLPNGRLLFGGNGFVAPSREELYQPMFTEPFGQALANEMYRRYPVLKPGDVDFFWGGTICATVSEKPVIAPVPGSKSLILAIVCNGHGMAVGSSAGLIVQDLVSPGSLVRPEERAFVEFCEPDDSLRGKIEGTMFKLLRSQPGRAAVNLIAGRRV